MARRSAKPWAIPVRKQLNKPMILFLDFDGTLTPIARRPELATLDREGKHLLRDLSRRIPVAVISGRALRDVRERVGVKELIYVGNHGLEIEDHPFKYQMPAASKWTGLIRKLEMTMSGDLGRIRGILIENKGLSLSVHYRLVRPGERDAAYRIFSKHVGPYRKEGRIRMTNGKAVWEVRPPYLWHKGKAVSWILGRAPAKGRWPIYIGDDRTDQDAFRAIRRKGIGFHVGSSREKGEARYSFRNPRAVRSFLRWLLKEISRDVSGVDGN